VTGTNKKKQKSYNKYLLVVLGSQLKVLVHLQRNRKEIEIDAFVTTHLFYKTTNEQNFLREYSVTK